MELYKKLLLAVTLVGQTATFTWDHEHRDAMHKRMEQRSQRLHGTDTRYAKSHPYLIQ